MPQPLKTTIYSPELEPARPSVLFKGMDWIWDSTLTRLGNLQKACLIEDYPKENTAESPRLS